MLTQHCWGTQPIDQDLMTHYHLYTANNHLYTTKYHLYTANNHLYTTKYHLYTTEYHLYSTEYHLYTTKYHVYTTALPRCRLYSNASQFIPESLSGMHGYLSLICLNTWFSIVLETRIIFDVIQVKAGMKLRRHNWLSFTRSCGVLVLKILYS